MCSDMVNGAVYNHPIIPVVSSEYDGKVELETPGKEIETRKARIGVKWIRCPLIINFINKPYSLTIYDNDKYGKEFERRLHKKELKEQGFFKKIYHYIDRENSKNESK